jgi:hypothetical protein
VSSPIRPAERPTLDTAARFFWLAIIVVAADAVILRWWHREPHYLALAAAFLALIGVALGPELRAPFERRGSDESALLVEACCAFAIFVACLAFYTATWSADSTPFNAHIRQAFAFVHGHLDIDAPNYIEHAQFHGKSYQLHPPLPAVMFIPFVAVWGMDTNQNVLSIILGALDVALAWRMLGRFPLTINARTWLTVFFGAGTILWFEAIGGTSWAVSMLVAIMFTLLALDEVFGGARPWLVGVFAALAALARYDLVLVWPIYGLLARVRGRAWRDLIAMLPAFAIAGAAYVLFNEARYRSVLDQTEFLFMEKGTQAFGLQYLPGNLFTILFMGPVVNGTFPYIHPTFGGQAIVLTSPAFLLALRPSFRRLDTALLGAATLLAAAPSLLYWANGYAQFGTRHYLHAFPFMLALMALGVHRRADQLTRILIVFSVVLIAFGVWHVQVYGYGS